jgi:hypothetical protein
MTEHLDGAQGPAAERERERRETALDETIEASFPASDPPSTDPNPIGGNPITPELSERAGEAGEGE